MSARMPPDTLCSDPLDFDDYLESEDAQLASPLQLGVLLSCRRAIGEPLTRDAYARMRGEFLSRFAQPMSISTKSH